MIKDGIRNDRTINEDYFTFDKNSLKKKDLPQTLNKEQEQEKVLQNFFILSDNYASFSNIQNVSQMNEIRLKNKSKKTKSHSNDHFKDLTFLFPSKNEMFSNNEMGHSIDSKDYKVLDYQSEDVTSRSNNFYNKVNHLPTSRIHVVNKTLETSLKLKVYSNTLGNDTLLSENSERNQYNEITVRNEHYEKIISSKWHYRSKSNNLKSSFHKIE